MMTYTKEKDLYTSSTDDRSHLNESAAELQSQ